MDFMPRTARNFRTVKPSSTGAVLRSSTLLNGLKEADLDFLAENSHLAFAEKGEVIWFNGSEIPFFGIAGTGFIKMVKSSAAGQETIVEMMGPGQMFGMLGTVDGTGCPLSARAISDGWYLKVPKREFMLVYQGSTLLKDHVISRTTQRLRQAYDLVARMARGGVEERMAAVLFVLSESYGEPSPGGFQLSVPLTRQDMAELSGTTVESAIRVCSRWQKEGIIKSEGRMISVMDEVALAEFIGAE